MLRWRSLRASLPWAMPMTGVAPENEDQEVPKNPLATRFRYRAAIAHPTPATYRCLPLRSRKQYKPTRFIAEGTASAAAAGSAGVVSALSAAVQGAMNEAQGSSTVASSESEATVDQPSSDDGESGTDAANAPAAWEASSSSSHRLPSRCRKQRRPEHFIPEEAEASARSKARRGNIALDRILTSLCVSPERRPECSRNVTADDVGGQGHGGAEGPEAIGGRERVLAVVAVLGASLVLCAVACVLFYVVGQRNEHGPSDGN
ncbi:hypothetical protein EJB05_31753 [Eragrostis curvula]|uniref:Uncharacterized protein n=1 Tax=Eragrostis curvula TaxID=38414 RepID=A0A5J9UEW6_9POAL|nr:hypothetical protein EJB05_31753 [Eragrostis curvula]